MAKESRICCASEGCSRLYYRRRRRRKSGRIQTMRKMKSRMTNHHKSRESDNDSSGSDNNVQVSGVRLDADSMHIPMLTMRRICPNIHLT